MTTPAVESPTSTTPTPTTPSPACHVASHEDMGMMGVLEVTG
ncbi:FtsP/CotA-like multicopper oxidase with cupredoxin domain [Saccharothrix ecbatanensis]|uniref:FtsP/CotA-like multicopper oxidase with cupredoxin domain n=1 Tax=Saccharothrix ecbatanensis TaxID=1105145 RepID=A0A7W9M0K5_9PSEU|nr:hypothetical protein [Saccharothrix ecbatanensis]MBB5802888.1 FtsP/CotA-like multicopper oxidase with cupredoxin domain [Saccharothrix ecbatanensis]